MNQIGSCDEVEHSGKWYMSMERSPAPRVQMAKSGRWNKVMQFRFTLSKIYSVEDRQGSHPTLVFKSLQLGVYQGRVTDEPLGSQKSRYTLKFKTQFEVFHYLKLRRKLINSVITSPYCQSMYIFSQYYLFESRVG